MAISYGVRIGIFDSGLGGLVIAKSIIGKLPQYDYIYLGDTKNLPYGSKSQEQIFKFTTSALRYLFAQDCKLVIIACNTASAKALRKIQREFLPKYFPNKKVLGVIVPTIEAVAGDRLIKKIGIISTTSTAKSHAYKKEIAKISPKLKVYEQGAPQLVPFIENNALSLANSALDAYLKPLLAKNIDALVLGCTHYPILKKRIQSVVGKKVKVFSQEEIIPGKLATYLKKHSEINSILSKKKSREFFVTKINSGFKKVAKRLFGKNINLKQITV
jgi:glutamate racemase